ncbi:MAG TPA: VOC family protein [Pyrinomonadaceae bacterium]|nr:VOC family protein [Pyrinomonadaceae bacterium]
MANTTSGASKGAQIEPRTQKITTFLWFDNNAEEAVNFYVSTFKNSKIQHIARYGETGPGPKGSVMTVDFELDGESFTALNGGPTFKFNEAISLVVHCKTQEEVDYFWEKLSEGGQKIECGWLKDKYGLAWQIVPEVFLDAIRDKDQEKVDRAMAAMMKMKKLEIKPLLEAMNG